MMLRSEIKKVFSRSKNKIAMILLLIILAATSILTVDRVEYVDEDGNASSGIAAARKLSAEQNKWAGYLTGDVLAEAVSVARYASLIWTRSSTNCDLQLT